MSGPGCNIMTNHHLVKNQHPLNPCLGNRTTACRRRLRNVLASTFLALFFLCGCASSGTVAGRHAVAEARETLLAGGEGLQRVIRSADTYGNSRTFTRERAALETLCAYGDGSDAGLMMPYLVHKDADLRFLAVLFLKRVVAAPFACDDVLDLGNFNEQDGVSLRFALRNVTREPRRISGIQTTCGCMEFDYPKDAAIPAGGTLEAGLRILPFTCTGELHHRFYVYADGMSNVLAVDVKGVCGPLVAVETQPVRHGKAWFCPSPKRVPSEAVSPAGWPDDKTLRVNVTGMADGVAPGQPFLTNVYEHAEIRMEGGEGGGLPELKLSLANASFLRWDGRVHFCDLVIPYTYQGRGLRRVVAVYSDLQPTASPGALRQPGKRRAGMFIFANRARFLELAGRLDGLAAKTGFVFDYHFTDATPGAQDTAAGVPFVLTWDTLRHVHGLSDTEMVNARLDDGTIIEGEQAVFEWFGRSGKQE